MNIYLKFTRVDKEGNTLLTPFVVSKEKKILFFHIAKTAGSTVAHVLQSAGLDDGVLSAKGAQIGTKNEYFSEVVNEWDSYFKFTFVRNKYDQLVSLWHYNKSKFKRSGRTFRTFISDYVLPSEDEYDYWIDQYYLTQPDLFDAIGRFENFEADFSHICERMGIKYDGRRDNVGHYDHDIHYSEYYDDDIQKMVYKKFQKEIDHFGFEIEVH